MRSLIRLRQTSPAKTKAALSLTPESLVSAFLEGRTKGTRKAYQHDLQDFMAFVGASSLEEAAKLLLSCDQGQANALALSYRARLLELELASATINRRLAALRSLVKLGRIVGLCSFTLEVESLPAEALRDARGPGRDGVARMLKALEARQDKKAKRDLALLRLLYDLALRRTEVTSLDKEHVDLAQNTLSVLGKGRRSRQLLTLPPRTKDALSAWLRVRGDEPGPLFVALDPNTYGDRLSGNGLYKMVQELGKKEGLKVRPHGLRHAAITDALDATGGNLRAVQKFSRHKDPKMLLIYDDARQDFQGEVAKLVSKRT
jgi:integrase/recombinase XerC